MAMVYEIQDNLKAIALDMGIKLFCRYDEDEASSIMDISKPTLQRRRNEGKIGYIQITERRVQYFGKHLVEFILNQEQRPSDNSNDVAMKEDISSAPTMKPTQTTQSKADRLASAHRIVSKK